MQRRTETATQLWCGACRAMHPKSTFGKDKNSPSGLTYACKEVVKVRNRRGHAKNKEAYNIRHAKRRRQRKMSPDADLWAIKKLVSDARRRAAKKGIEFRLVAENIRRPARCPIFGMRLIYQANERRVDNSASIDRIDNRSGYTPENVWIISWRANQVKTDATPDELRTVADAVEVRVGKKAAGRLLDGREWNEYPEALHD